MAASIWMGGRAAQNKNTQTTTKETENESNYYFSINSKYKTWIPRILCPHPTDSAHFERMYSGIGENLSTLYLNAINIEKKTIL